ncbi:MAG: hypothetical protein ACLS7Z_12790 [Christensenellales bacterium]
MRTGAAAGRTAEPRRSEYVRLRPPTYGVPNVMTADSTTSAH